MNVLIRRAKEMLMSPAEYARAVAFIARNNRRAKAALLKEEKRLLQRLSRPALTPPTPYRAPGRPAIFFARGWKTVTAEVIEAMIEDEEVSDLVLGVKSRIEYRLHGSVEHEPVRKPALPKRQAKKVVEEDGCTFRKHLVGITVQGVNGKPLVDDQTGMVMIVQDEGQHRVRTKPRIPRERGYYGRQFMKNAAPRPSHQHATA